MPRKKNVTIEDNTISGTAEDITIALLEDVAGSFNHKEVQIKSAVIKDDFCNYSYELKTGATAGDEVKRTGASVVHDDLKNAFKKLNVHVAFIDDAFLVAGHNIDDIDKWHDSEITEKYFAIGFKLSGSGENEQVIIQGAKTTSHGIVYYATPAIMFTGSYAFIDELRVVVDDCIEEVYKYLHGKAAPKLVQQEMEFEKEGAE